MYIVAFYFSFLDTARRDFQEEVLHAYVLRISHNFWFFEAL